MMMKKMKNKYIKIFLFAFFFTLLKYWFSYLYFYTILAFFMPAFYMDDLAPAHSRPCPLWLISESKIYNQIKYLFKKLNLMHLNATEKKGSYECDAECQIHSLYRLARL